MATGNNPLQLLREFIINNKEIDFLDKDGNLTTKIEEAEQIKFGDAGTFDKNELTNYYFSKKAADRYSLISMLYFWKNRNEGYYTYLKATQLNKIQGVSFTFKTDLIDYLSGKKETSDNLKDQKEIEQLENSLDVENEDLDEGRLGSKRSNEEEEELTQMCKQIAKRERVLGGRNSILTSNKSFEHVIKISEEMLKKALEGGKEEKSGAKSVQLVQEKKNHEK
ncbi:Cell division control protein 73 [Zancudomyces culisetae]|uniref:Cell division control protein 73 n=1 Tax=Zancudomyces culisetae TaxID=1213189 RepID=A0A1R1PNN1_ZANCU|nr:Cell division control protein 73 [Zancudomyces culisetae]|eukprot:OMH82564.1 Cell division control protein 73 [Zancudomyces culisetae]